MQKLEFSPESSIRRILNIVVFKILVKVEPQIFIIISTKCQSKQHFSTVFQQQFSVQQQNLNQAQKFLNKSNPKIFEQIAKINKKNYKMYTVLKSKRFHFQIPEKNKEKISEEQQQSLIVSRQSTDMIVGSCFLDDNFILFLFNSGRYLIVTNFQSSTNHQTHQKFSSEPRKSPTSVTGQSSILYLGNIISELNILLSNHEYQPQNQQIQFQQSQHKKLLLKSSLKIIEQIHQKILFTHCKRIKLNECIILTKHSAKVYWLRMIKSQENITEYNQSIKTQIKQLPNSILGDMIKINGFQTTISMTVLTELIEFDSTTQQNCYNGRSISPKINNLRQEAHFIKKSQKFNKNSSRSNKQFEKGSFFIKNQIIQDKMVYLTVFTRIPQDIRNQQLNRQCQLYEQTKNSLKVHPKKQMPYFIITKFQYPIPLNQVSSNYIFDISDKQNNEIAIYKQSEDDQNQWVINLYCFDFYFLQGHQILESYFLNLQDSPVTDKELSISSIAIMNKKYIPKPKVVVLPEQFTSSIHLQQFIRFDFPSSAFNQLTYLIVSINQNFEENVGPQQNFIQQLDQDHAYRVNGQLVHYDQNGIIRQIQGERNSKNCWIHLCRLTLEQNSNNFTQRIQKIQIFALQTTSFLKIININYEYQLMYVLRLAHQKVDGQLYENKLELINMRTGKVVQKGYLSIKNYSFSPNQKYILDVPYTFTNQADFFYQIRILFHKKSLYAFMIENSKKYFEGFKNVNFIQSILKLL